MSEAFHTDPIDAELQVRLMNLVMGEASDFERDQLQLLMEQRPELAAYMQHIEHLHGLLCVVGTDDASIDVDESTVDKTWQLPTDRREKLLAFLDGKELLASPLKITSVGPLSKRRIQRSRWYVAALVVAAAASLLVGLMLPAVQSARPAAKFMGGTAETYYLNDDVQYFPNALGRKTGQASGEDNFRAQVALADDVQSAQTLRSFASNSNAPAKAVARAKEPQSNASTAEKDSVASVPSDGPILLGGISRTAGTPERTVDTDWNSRKVTSSTQLAMPRILVEAEKPLSGSVVDMRDVEAAERKLKTSQTFGAIQSQDEAPRISASPDQVLANDTEYFGKPTDGVEPADKLRLRQWNDQTDGIKASGVGQQPDQSVDQKNGLAVPTDQAKGLGVPSKPSAGTSLFGDVQTDFIEDLDLVIIKGAERDVQRTKAAIDTRKTDNETAGKESKLDAKSQESADNPSTYEYKKELGQAISDVRSSVAAQAGQAGESKQVPEPVGEVASAATTPNGRVLGKDLEQHSDQGEPVVTLYDTTASMRYSRREADLGRKYTPAPSPEITSSSQGRVNLKGKPGAVNPIETLDEQMATAEAFSTFSLHVSDVSFKLAQAALAQGQWPEAAKIRIEEFVNALDYHDPLPAGNEKVACRVEQAIHPFLMQRNLLRISMRTAATGRAQTTPLRLTIVLDNSGSMERTDRRQAVVQAMQMLTKQLRASDQVTLISFANTPRLLAEKVVGDQGASLVKLIENLPSEGGTNIEAALLLAREKALEQRQAGAQNRIVLLTDGAVNLGNANPESLAKLVTQMRDAGIAFDAAGISAADLNDEVLEALTRQGDGRYYLLDSADAVAESFAAQIAGALRPSAQNVKVQVEFNPQRVGRYKLLGFEKHRLKQEDFRNDKVDAAEMAAAEAGVAVYHYEIKPNGSGDVGSVSVRFRDLSTGQMFERRWPIPYDSSTPRLEQAEPTMQLAATAALFAAKLSGGPLADSVDLNQLQQWLANVTEQYATQPRVVQLRTMIEQARAIK